MRGVTSDFRMVFVSVTFGVKNENVSIKISCFSLSSILIAHQKYVYFFFLNRPNVRHEYLETDFSIRIL